MNAIDEDRFMRAYSTLMEVAAEDVRNYAEKNGLSSLITNAGELLNTPSCREKFDAFMDLYLISEYVQNENPDMSNSDNAVAVMKTLFEKVFDKESAVVIYLDSQLKLKGYERCALGTLNQAMLVGRDIFRGALMNNAAAIIIGHNHPSGDTTPSSTDIESTRRLIELGKLVGIPVLDHLVISGFRSNDYVSFKREGLLSEAEVSYTAENEKPYVSSPDIFMEERRNENMVQEDVFQVNKEGYRVIEKWEENNITKEDYITYAIGYSVNDDGTWYAGRAIDTSGEYRGVYVYEFGTDRPTRSEVEDVHLDHLSEIALDRYEAEFGADGSRVFPNFNLEEVERTPNEGEIRMTKINVLMVEPGQEPYMKEIDNDLASMQKEVGGYIETTYPFSDPVAIICNEEGKLEDLPLNRALYDEDGKIYDILSGTFIVAGLSEEGFASLSPELQDKYTMMYQHPEAFVSVKTSSGNQIMPITLGEKTISYEAGNKEKEAPEWQKKQEEKLSKLQDDLNKIADTYVEKPETLVEYFKFAAQFYKYSVRNTMLIRGQNPGAVFAGSFKFFSAQGYSVRKGESGMKVFVPVEVKRFKTADGKIKSVKYATKEEKAKIERGEIQVTKQLYFTIGTVFDIAQTNIPFEDYPKFFNPGYASMEHRQIADLLTAYTEQNVCRIKTEPFSGIALYGCFTPSKNEIQLAPRLTDTMRLATLLHELGHAIMHNQNVPLSRTRIEFQADAFCVMLSQHLGLAIPDSLQRHLAQEFGELKKEYTAKMRDASPEELKNTIRERAIHDLEAVNKAFNQHVKGIDALLQIRNKTPENVPVR